MGNVLKTIIFFAVVGTLLMILAQYYFGNFLTPQGGFFISIDAGGTWQKSGSLEPSGNINRLNVLDIKSNPKDSRILYATTLNSGILKSVDGGAIWHKLADKNNILSPRANIFGIAVDPKFPDYAKNIPDKFYLAVYQNSSGKVLRTDDGGVSFKEMYITTKPKVAVFDVAVNPNNPNIVWAATGEGILLKSQNYGETWNLAQEFGKPINYLLLNPRKTSEMLVTTFSGNVFTSTDGGISWTDDSDGIKLYKNARFIENVVYNSLDGYVYLTSRFGLLKSADFGINWQAVDIVFPNNALPITDIAFGDRGSRNIYLSASNFVYASKDGGKFWQVRKLGTTSQMRTLWVDPKNPDKIIAGTGNSGKSPKQKSLIILPTK